MGKKLWEVYYNVALPRRKQRRRRYAIGDTKSEAIEQCKKFLSKDGETSDFYANLVDTGSGQIFMESDL